MNKIEKIRQEIKRRYDYENEMYHKKKPVVTHGETYHVDTLGTQQVIAGKMPQKPAEWSEEDEIYLQDALWCVEKAEKSCKDEEDKGACWSAKRWLKSLRPVSKESLQPHWKPSEHQMSMLLAVVNDPNNAGSESCYISLKSLYNDLKKL